MKYRLPRFVSGLLACLTLFALWEIIQIKGASLIQQPSLASVASVCCLIVALFGFAGMLASNQFWEKTVSRKRSVYTYFSQSTNPADHWSGGLLLSCSLIIYFVLMSHLIPQQPRPENNDQAAFLSQANEVQEFGGPSVFIRRLFSGTYEEANQHPLYVALLSYLPDYETGKRLSAICGLFTLLVFSIGISLHYGNLTGGLTGLLICINAAYCQLTGRVVCEGLLLVFIAGLWLLVLKLPDLRQSRFPFLYLTAMGCLLGLAWLTKGTALLILLGLVIWFVSYAIPWNRLLARFSNRTQQDVDADPSDASVVSLKRILASLCLIAITFTLIASPLLVRNARVYGSPTFNANSYLMFQDEFTEPHALAKQGTLREAAQAYLKTHSIPDIIKREVKGLIWQVFIFLRSLGPLPFEEGRLFFGILAIPFLVIGLLAETHPARRLYLIWMVLFWLAFAWYLPIAAGERFLMPLLLPTLAFISLGIVRVGQYVLQRAA